MWSESAENLMLGTAAQESHIGKYLMQVDASGDPAGPALGIYQMEPATHDDIWQNFINIGGRNELEDLVENICFTREANEMIFNLQYATALARLKYWRDPEPLPQAGDIEGLAHIWKRVYNTPLGKGTVQEFVDNYHRFVSGVE